MINKAPLLVNQCNVHARLYMQLDSIIRQYDYPFLLLETLLGEGVDAGSH